MTHRAVLTSRDIRCEHSAMTDHGVKLSDESDSFVAFVPYASLQSLLNEAAGPDADPSLR